MKVIITESQYNRAVDFYISFLFDPHEVKIGIKRPKSIVWTKDGKTIVEIVDSEEFWVDPDIWEDISRMFNLDYFETQSVIKDWLEQHHNFGELTPFRDLPNQWLT